MVKSYNMIYPYGSFSMTGWDTSYRLRKKGLIELGRAWRSLVWAKSDMDRILTTGRTHPCLSASGGGRRCLNIDERRKTTHPSIHVYFKLTDS